MLHLQSKQTLRDETRPPSFALEFRAVAFYRLLLNLTHPSGDHMKKLLPAAICANEFSVKGSYAVIPTEFSVLALKRYLSPTPPIIIPPYRIKALVAKKSSI